MADDDGFLTVSEAAALLKTTARNVRRAIDNGDIPSVRVSERVVRIPAADFIAKSAGGAGADGPVLDPIPANDPEAA